MDPRTLILVNLCLAFYNVGTIWANEVDIFRSWKLLDNDTFQKVHLVHWHKIPFWIFIPYGIFLAASVGLVWYHPPGAAKWAIWGNLACFLCGYVFTSGSPSSGMQRVRVYNDKGVPSKVGVGIWARAFMERFPLLPVEDEGRLRDPDLRENFMERIFALKR